ncbi:hypothetical protein LCL61_06935 [Amycolatopsis coloradensis]|uniref:Uncharacterized protein n=1 Tax=Amycolatopsis coloradensis TaxID=76021 RepID=A0ACD5B7E6_9PSEU
MAARNVLAELGALHLTRPAVDAPVASVAAWYERKAVVLEHLAATGAAGAAEQAEQAHQHAAQLMAVA